jgi:hypothetical protein
VPWWLAELLYIPPHLRAIFPTCIIVAHLEHASPVNWPTRHPHHLAGVNGDFFLISSTGPSLLSFSTHEHTAKQRRQNPVNFLLATFSLCGTQKLSADQRQQPQHTRQMRAALVAMAACTVC